MMMMKKQATPTNTTRSERDVFAEMTEGFAALAEAREGKRTLRMHPVPFRPGRK